MHKTYVNWPDIWKPMGLIDKAIELVLIVLLWLDRKSRNKKTDD
ncbi:MAG: hypothetical protein M5U34_17280 [Chloroflexi bacterium]|nr:hypothetical protein [Chloroflexota bacterium]